MIEPNRVKMAELARLSGVPAPTIKHYIREGLLPEPTRTHRNMAYYDVALVPRIRKIKALQRSHFLPLRVIKEVLAMEGLASNEDTVAASIASVLVRASTAETRTRAELVAHGMPAPQLDWLRAAGLLSPSGTGDEETYTGDDLELLRILGASRRAGISPEMLPVTILRDYVRAIRALVRIEMDLFRRGVMPQAKHENLAMLTQTAATLSERLVVVLRRKFLLPTLRTKPSRRKRATRH
jgi:DNA-binding transcriptional MerR regulator